MRRKRMNEMVKIEVGLEYKLDTVQMLKDHSREVPAQAGYTPFEFSWREAIDSLEDVVLTITLYGDYFIRFNYVDCGFVCTCSFNRVDVEKYLFDKKESRCLQ